MTVMTLCTNCGINHNYYWMIRNSNGNFCSESCKKSHLKKLEMSRMDDTLRGVFVPKPSDG